MTVPHSGYSAIKSKIQKKAFVALLNRQGLCKLKIKQYDTSLKVFEEVLRIGEQERDEEIEVCRGDCIALWLLLVVSASSVLTCSFWTSVMHISILLNATIHLTNTPLRCFIFSSISSLKQRITHKRHKQGRN